MEKGLPEGWKEYKLGDFSFLKNGYAFKSTDYVSEGIPIIRISNIKDGEITVENSVCIPKEKANWDFTVENGDILIAMSGATTGKFGVYTGSDKCLQNQRVGNFKLKNPNAFNKRFLFYLVANLKKKIEEEAYGGAQPNISSKKIEEFEVQVPPLPEQHRIVAKLDAVLAKVDSARERMERLPGILQRFRQSVLAQAVSGKLTEGWRKENEGRMTKMSGVQELNIKTHILLPETWFWASFSQVANVISNLVSPFDFQDMPLIAPDNIEKFTGNLIDYQTVRESKAISAKHSFKSGQIVYSKIRPYLSKLVIAKFDGLCSADMYPIESKLETEYLFRYMLSETFLEYATNSGSRTVLPKINQKELGQIPVPVPPLAEQKEIVRRVQTLFAVADRLEARYEALREKVEGLPQALLAKAFRGELVGREA